MHKLEDESLNAVSFEFERRAVKMTFDGDVIVSLLLCVLFSNRENTKSKYQAKNTTLRDTIRVLLMLPEHWFPRFHRNAAKTHIHV